MPWNPLAQQEIPFFGITKCRLHDGKQCDRQNWPMNLE